MSDVDATPQFDLSEATLPAAARRSRQVSVWASIRQQRLAMTGLVLVGLFLLVALFGPYMAPYGPTEQAIMDALQPPSSKHWLGTDDFGRDIFSRLLYGARISLEVGIVAVGIAGSIGILLGLLAGYVGGWVDNVLTLLMDIVFAFPAILLAIAIISLLGNNLIFAMFAIAIVYTPTFMRVVRGATLSVRNMAYVESAVAIGASTPRILFAHVFPNIVAPLIVLTSLNFAFAVLAEASLAFLGLGNKPPAPSWGSMVSTTYGFLQLAPWAPLAPGIAIGLAVLGFNLLGDGLRDALDPRQRVR